MRKSLRPLHVFFLGMIFGAGALHLLADVSWRGEPVTPAAPVPVLPAQIIPPADAPIQKPNEPEEPNAERAGSPAIILDERVLSQQPTVEPLQTLSLLIPVQGVSAAQLIDTYSQARANGRVHEAIDIASPNGTPVLAVADGKIVKLFDSKPGGLTVYQFDASETYAYYYAHLNGYAEGIVEGKLIKRGEQIGTVGSTGNASPAAPHLHFAIFKLGPAKNWWQGSAVNPYPLLAGD